MKKSVVFRLYAGITLAVVMFLVVIYYTLNTLQKQETENTWVTQIVKVIEKLRDIRYELLQMRAARHNYWITGNENYLNDYLSGMKTVPTHTQLLLTDVKDDEIIQPKVKELDASVMALFTFWENTGKVNNALSKENFTNITNTEEEKVKAIYNQFDRLISMEIMTLSNREKNLTKYNSQVKQTILIGVIGLLILVMLLVNAVVKTLNSRIRAGNKLQRIIEDMEKVTRQFEEKNWVLEGVSYINTQMLSNERKTKLQEDIINAVVTYLEVPAGAIYMADEYAITLTISASVAVSASAGSFFRVGEGIVGNAALQKKITLIKNIPPDYWKIESATGITSGKGEIACVPLWVDDELKAVIELGNLNPFSDKQIQLLEAISNNLASAIHSRQASEKNYRLLHQVQEQKETLLSQQEELRQTNEELTRQADELQASEEELKTQEEELRQINQELIEKTDTLETARQAILLKARELESTSRYKSEFLANMSHELRTPLNSVLILAKLLEDNSHKNLTDKQIEYAKIIHKSGTDLLELINNILDLSKIEAGKVDLIVEEVKLTNIVDNLSQLFSVVASEKKVVFSTQIQENLPPIIKTDIQRVEQVLKNLLSNAFKFTGEGGSVSLQFENYDTNDKKRIGIKVMDSGIGISTEKQNLIFEAFQQADGSTSRQYGGTGLGLSISKELAKLLGGEITLSSEEGKGSIFTLILPWEIIPQEKTTEIVPGDVILASPEYIIPQEKVEDDRNKIEPKDRVMLIIEDDETFASILKDFAREKGYKPIVALKGDEGLFYARHYKPDTIILDIQLPVIDGWTLLKMFKEDPRLSGIPVHIISAFDDNRLHSSGALAYVKKPIDKKGLEKAFETIGTYLSENIKKVLVISDSHLIDENLTQLFWDKQNDVSFIHEPSLDNARERIHAEKFDCLIVDIGNKIAEGIRDIQLIRNEMEAQPIPVIIYLDTDISPADEWQLKKVSNAIVRESPYKNSRLKDELELFLYKVEESRNNPVPISGPASINDDGLKGKKILLVDDDMRNVFALSNALEIQKLDVIAAADGRESLNILAKNKDIDLILMDIMMPEMDGFEAIKKIRGELKMTNIPIIALTAKAMTGDREKCLEAGASDYITKPVDISKLLSLLRVWLSS